MLDSEISETENAFEELDHLAEDWIGNNLGRWEWYERTKARRAKMMSSLRKQERQLDDDYDELRRTFMDFDALFGTGMLDEEGSVSNMGWTMIGSIMVLYVGLGYWILESIAKVSMDAYAGLPPF